MVFAVPFRCDTCDTLISLKIQADDSLFAYDYPISLECPNCGARIQFVYNKDKGIFPLKYRTDGKVSTEYDLYYSALLPVDAKLHFKPSKNVTLTPFMFLSTIYNGEKVVLQNKVGKRFLDNVYPFRKVFQELLPIYRKGNIAAYSKKLTHIFNITQKYTPISDIKTCRIHLFELLQNTYNNLSTDEYLSQIANPYLVDTIQVKDIDSLKAPFAEINKIVNYNQWQKRAFNFISDMIAKFEKYMPSLFYCTVGDFVVPHESKLETYTIDREEVIKDYNDSFNLIKDLLSLIVGLSNFKLAGSIDDFPNKNEGMKGVSGLEDFHLLPDGLKFDKLQDYYEVNDYLAGGFNHKIRNGIGHKRWGVVHDTQIIQFRYKQNDDDEHYDIQLVDLGYLVVINLLHMMEFVLLIEKIKK